MASRVFEFKNPRPEDIDFTLGDHKIRCVPELGDGLDVMKLVRQLASGEWRLQVDILDVIFDQVVVEDDKETFRLARSEARPSLGQLAEIADWALGEYMRFPTEPPPNA